MESLAPIAAQIGSNDRLRHISEEIKRAQQLSGFPQHQLLRWIWLASQFRIHELERNEIARNAGAALLFFSKTISGARLSEVLVQDLNWVLDSTVWSLGHALDPSELRSCLSADELRAIENKIQELSQYDAFDLESIRTAIEARTSLLSDLGSEKEAASLKHKIEVLVNAALRAGSEATTARAALLYVAEEADVVSDAYGYLGLLDDLYVIEWAYAAVENQTRCLPLLDALLRDWPFVAETPILNGGGAVLDRFSQFVCCTALFALRQQQDNGMLIVREVGPYAILAALMTAIACAREEAKKAGQDAISNWKSGEPVTVSDGSSTFRATFLGSTEIGGRTKYRLGVRDSGSLTVDQSVLPYIARAVGRETDKRLSRGNDILAWLKDRHLDPLFFLTGATRHQIKNPQSILLLGPRHKLDRYLPHLQLLGVPASGLLGIRYVNSLRQTENLGGTATDSPFIYACSDPGTASDLISGHSENVSGWLVIVDTARLAENLLATLPHGAGEIRICVLAELKEREASRNICRFGNWKTLFAEDQDVLAPDLKFTSSIAGDPISRFVNRQSNHWAASQSVHLVQHKALEDLADWLRDGSAQGRQPETRGLEFAVSSFLQKAISVPCMIDGAAAELARLSKSILAHASILRQFDPSADNVFRLGQSLNGFAVPDRMGPLAQVVDEADPSERIAVVCRSIPIAEKCREYHETHPNLRRLSWMNLERLREFAPCDRVIVPGWLDRLAMRELATNGYGAVLELILLPFEKRWFDATVSSVRAWERRLESESTRTLSAVEEQAIARGTLGPMWRKQTNLRLSSASPLTSDDEKAADDAPEFEKLEARALNDLTRSLSASRPGQISTKAKLVLLEEPGAYLFLPPAGRVIVLSNQFDSTGVISREQAERLLFRKVTALQTGMVLALPLQGDRDLIDVRADQYLSEARRVRADAALWRTAVRRAVGDHFQFAQNFASRLEEAGEPRDPGTVRAWTYQTHTVAPRNYRKVVPLIARLTNDTDLTAKLDRVLQSIDLIYRARTSAAEAIVRELFSGEIDLDSDELRFELSGAEFVYRLHRVRHLGETQEVPLDFIGKVRHFSEVPQGAGTKQ
ncbi:MAG TPA: hypothetical protein VG897_05465 [Terriglobales bacterium]|nr:hypothetical protein [Terriglobales bacterium]